MGQLVFQAALGGQVNLVGPNTASTFNLNVPAASDTLVARATTDTLTNKTLTSPVISGGTIDNAVIGGTTAVAGSFTTLSASSTVSGTGFSTYLASPPAIGGTTAAAGTFTTLNTSGAITTTASVNTPNTFGFKNRIINGAMVIDQRNAGASVNNNISVDRFFPQVSSGTLTLQQTTSIVPAGFAYALGITVTSVGTRNATDFFDVYQVIEGFNVSDLGFGASGAASVTLSFWVRSSVTGTYSGVLASGDNTRSYAFTYSIPTANTWTQISVTIAGDTSGGLTAYPINNTAGLRVKLDLGSGSNFQITAGSWQAATNKIGATGSVGWAQTAGATFYITGVQLEKGSTATSFDYRPYGTELQLCQRYYETGTLYYEGYADLVLGTAVGGVSSFKVTKRAVPTMAYGTFSSGFHSAVGATRNVYVDMVQRYCNVITSTGECLGYEPWTASAEL